MISDPNKLDNELLAIQQNAEKFEKRKKSTSKLPKYYAKNLSSTLFERVKESLNESKDEQVHIFEELALLRESAAVHVHHFSECYELFQTCMSNADSIAESDRAEVKLALSDAGNRMAEVFDRITRTAKLANDIVNSAKDKFSVFDLQDVVSQAVRILFECCGTEHEHIARIFESRLENELSFMQEKTNITPDQQVLAMDACIPLVDADGNGTAVL